MDSNKIKSTINQLIKATERKLAIYLLSTWIIVRHQPCVYTTIIVLVIVGFCAGNITLPFLGSWAQDLIYHIASKIRSLHR
jgi:hypothetical protein